MTQDIIKSFQAVGTEAGPEKRVISQQEFIEVIEDFLNRGYHYGLQEGGRKAAYTQQAVDILYQDIYGRT